jgi:hypothetical protein
MFCGRSFFNGTLLSNRTNTGDLQLQAFRSLAGLNYLNLWNDSNQLWFVGQRMLGEMRWQMRASAKDDVYAVK